jgi:hypothetical protein
MISVITVTNKTNTNIIDNILNNYTRQVYPEKELLLYINSDEPVMTYKNKCDEMNIKNCKIIKLHPFITLGECLNDSIKKMNGLYWAKMDDDDYYDKQYLTEAHFYLQKTGADLIGKKSVHIYDEDTKTMYDINQSKNKFVDFVRGPTFFCHKILFWEPYNEIRFDNINKGEDTQFINALNKCHKNIYATSNKNFIYIRNSKLNQTSDISLKKYLGLKYKIKK